LLKKNLKHGGHMPLQISLTQQFEHQQSETWGVHFSLDGKKLVSSDGTALYLWQFDEQGNWDFERSLPFRNAVSPRFAPNGTMLAFRGEDEFIRLISVDGREIATLPRRVGFDCAFSPDGHWLVAGDAARNVLLWDLFTYQLVVIPVRFPRLGDDLQGNESAPINETVRGFQFTPDGQRFALLADSEDGYLHLCYFDPTDQSLLRQKTFPHGCMDLAVSPDGTKLAAIIPTGQLYSHKEEVYLYDLESLRRLHVFPQTTNKRYCLLAFSPDSRYLASCKSDGWVDIFSLGSFGRIAQFAAHPGLSSHASDPIGGLDWSTTGYLATGGASVFEHDMRKTDYSIKLWKVEEVEDSR